MNYCRKCNSKLSLLSKLKSLTKSNRQLKCEKCKTTYRTKNLSNSLNSIICMLMSVLLTSYIQTSLLGEMITSPLISKLSTFVMIIGLYFLALMLTECWVRYEEIK